MLLAAVLVAAIQPAAAQEVLRIAAIVNDDVISVYDLNARMRLAIISTGLRDSPSTRRRIAPQVLRSLIDERLQMQEAKRRNISVTKRELKRAISSLEKANKLGAGTFNEFMTSKGVELQTVTNQIRASIAWSKLIRRRYRPRIRVGEDEVDEVLARLKASRGQLEFRLSEVFLSVDTPEGEPEIRRSAARMVEQIRGGARFAAVARQFSESATAVVGGDLGWVPVGALPDHLKSVVPKLARGRVSDPIRTVSGYQIVALRARRRIAEANARDIKVTLNQLFLPVAQDAGKDGIDRQRTVAATLKKTVSGCDALTAQSKKLKSPAPPRLGIFVLADLSSVIRDAITDLEVGTVSRPIESKGGLLVLMVCERDEPESGLPDRETIRDQLVSKRIDLISRRLLRDVRLAAVVDVRV